MSDRVSHRPGAPRRGRPGLFTGVLARGAVACAVDDTAWLQAMLDVEAALARAGAAAGVVPAAAAEAITAVCLDAGWYDAAALGAAAAATGNPVVPLVRAIEELADQHRAGAGAAVHRGATSQDILDTATCLVARRALVPMLADLDAARDAAARLAAEHRDTVLAGRTLLQQALPTTFGLKAAGWALALDGAGARLRAVAAALPLQLGGAAGTLAALDGHGTTVVDALAAELDLAVPVLPWHTLRLPVLDLAGALGTAAAVLGKAATDVVLLAQTEVGEVSEGTPGRGGSSAMPHKRNPVAAVAVRAATRRAPGLVATLLSAAEQEHERAAGGWHAEWLPLTDLLTTVGSAAAWLRDCLEHLAVHPEAMRRNLAPRAADLASEAVAGALADSLGRAAAHDLVATAITRARDRGDDLRAVLLAEPAVAGVLSGDQLDRLLDPAAAVGEAPALTDRALRVLGGPAARPTPGGTP
ncbi:MAG: 3-carboxy-cis,cis-muconate cycloisomerase [Mycobacterium sp.]|nr:3-carboxy-cis,cis-muconate cycloisomerase [Mycobacterium sp.]